MSLQILYGSAGAGKSHTLYHTIIEESIKHPEKNYLILVPEQFTMQTQKKLVGLHPRHGILNIDILSFERLAYRVLEEVGGESGLVLEEIGKSLILQKLAQEKKEQLSVLGANLKKPGYIGEMKSLVSEYIQYDLGEEQLDQLQKAAADNGPLLRKLEDVRLIYEAFLEELSGRYITAEEVLDVLCRALPRSQRIRCSTIALDGYTGFTPIQNKVIRELLRYAEKLMVTVTMGDGEDPCRMEGDHHLFALSKKTVRRLMELAVDAGAEIEPSIPVAYGNNSRFCQAEALHFLEAHLFRYGRQRESAVFPCEPREIHVREEASPREEMAWTARQICRLVRSRGYHYRDMAVITGDMEGYRDFASEAFTQAQIPYFLDTKRSVLQNPFVEYIRSLVDLLVQNFSYESVFRHLRCGMSALAEEEIDELENYVLALGIRGKSGWGRTWVRHYRGMKPERVLAMEGIRVRFFGQIEPLAEVLRKTNTPVREKISALYRYIAEADIQRKLKTQEQYFQEAGELALAKEYAQIYGIVIGLFDKLVEILGDAAVPLAELQAILDAGFSEARVGIIPPGADQVVVGDVERTRLPEIKVLFFVGVNDGCIPKSESSGGILSDFDREYLESSGVELAPTARENMMVQRFYLYLALTRPERELYLSYSMASAAGEKQNPSYLVGVLRKMFPQMQVESAEDELWQIEETGTIQDTAMIQEMEQSFTAEERMLLRRVEYPESGLSCLIEGLRTVVRQEPSAAWCELYSWYMRQEKYKKRVCALTEAAFYRNPHDAISRAAAAALYGGTLKNSASRLERFAACAYAHFLEYGLRLHEREQYEFRAADLGTLVHGALEAFARELRDSPYTWANLPEHLRDQLIDESVEAIVEDYGNTVLHSTSRNTYMIRRVKRIMRRTVWALQEQLKAGDFVPDRFEASFAMEDPLQAAQIRLSGEQWMILGGRIDRVDILEEGDRVYVKIIDYKSGSMAFDLSAVCHGLQLQLALYLSAALELEQKSHPGKQVEPAGIFYYDVDDPVTDYAEGLDEDRLRRELLKQLKVRGLVREDDSLIRRMDHALEQGGTSLVIPVSYNKSGELSKKSNTASARQFMLLSRFAREKAAEIGERIIGGETTPAPEVHRKKSACAFCAYRAICGFDPRLPGYKARILPELSKEEVWRLMEGRE